MNAAELRFKSSFDNLSANVIITDCNHIVTYINTAAVTFFNNVNSNLHDKLPHAKSSDLIGKSVSEFHRNTAYQLKLLNDITDKIKLSFKLGNSIIEMNISPLFDKSGKRLGSMIEWEDVTNEMSTLFELDVANKELIFQKLVKETQAKKLVAANANLYFQNLEKEKRTQELIIANENIIVMNKEYQTSNEELRLQNIEKQNWTNELLAANTDLYFQKLEKEKQAHELALANENMAVMTEEYIASNEELKIQNLEKGKRADELVIANQELAYQNSEKIKRADELVVANADLYFQNIEKEKRANELELIITQNEVLNQQVNHLQKLESIGRMTAGIAHDFNNILACMMGYNEMSNDVCADMKDENLRNELASNIGQVSIAGQRAMALIEKMMTYSRQDTHSTKEINVEHTVIAIRDVLAMLRPALTSRIQIEFIQHCHGLINGNCSDCIGTDDCEIDIQIDVVALHQILTNLAVNARDAMKEQGGVITISLSKETKSNTQCVACRAIIDGEFIELSVSDKGTGIEPQVINRIFDPFFTTKPQGEGTGLGLSTLTGLVHSALGHIVVDSDMSELNHGTTFRMLFPVVKYNS